MDKKRQDTIDRDFFKSFFHSTLNRWMIGVSIVLLSTVFFYYITIPPKRLFPYHKDFKVIFYNDGGNGGKSEILKQNVCDSLIEFEFELKEGFLTPYVGLSIAPSNGSAISLSCYNQIGLRIAGQKVKGVGVALFTINPTPNKAAVNNELCFYTNLEISPEIRRYTIPLDQMKIPDWWSELNHISSKEKSKPDLKNVVRLNIGTAYSPVLGTNCSLVIKEISFERNNKKLILHLLLAELVAILLLMIIHFLRAKLKRGAEPVTITYKPVDIENENQQLNSFLGYINHNFHNQELTLEQVSNHTGINQRRIANSIQQTFGCNFKTYINRIRISESKRLLKKSELNMGEIAFKVGFSNQTHFNRVFKSSEGISPSEFRGGK